MRLLFVAIFASFLASVNSLAAEKKLALVIGVSQYTYLTVLPRSKTDALEVGRMYQRQGFEISWATDINKTDSLKKSIVAFSEKVKSAAKTDTVKVLLYYSGHGIEAAGGNWFLGPDFDPRKVNYNGRAVYEKYAFDAKAAIDLIVKAGAGSTLFVLDACRINGIKVRGGRELRPGYDTRVFGTIPNFVMLYAAASGSVAYDTPSTTEDDGKKNSVFTQYFLRYAESLPDISQLADKLQTEVAAATRGKEVVQHPSYYDGYSGSYYLFDTDSPRGVSQSGAVVRIFYREGRASEAARLAHVMEQNGFYYSLVPDDLSDVSVQLKSGSNRVVSARGLNTSERSRLERVKGLISLMDAGVAPRIDMVPAQNLLAKPFQIQMY